uniref:Dehydrogenase/reductase (SDR family) member 7 n=1 Tax=Salmo trutta TaxID=8032 RepID=A0A674EJF2_SALTR
SDEVLKGVGLVGRAIFSQITQLAGCRLETKLKGLVVFFTGASSGIGEELAYQLAGCGSRLILSARRVDELDRRSNLQEKHILVLKLHDSSHLSTLACFVPISLSMPIQIDILINNGGRSQCSLSLETSVDVYQVLMEHNFLGTVSVTKQVLPHMMQRGSCSIVTVSSTPGNYVNHLDTYIEADFPRILISTVCPGPVLSQIVQNTFTEEAILTAGEQQHKMSTSCCVCLILVGITNGAKEMWITWQTVLLFNYVWQYAPIWTWFITDVLGRKRVQNFKVGLDADSAYFTNPKTS